MSIMCTDPVCGTLVHPAHAAAVVDYEGTTHYFCDEKCQVRFIAEHLWTARHEGRPLAVEVDDRKGRVVHLVTSLEPAPDRPTAH